MALHNTLPIFKVCYDLIGAIVEAAKHMPNDVKRLLGQRLLDDGIELSMLIYDANVAADKKKPLEMLLRRLEAILIALRIGRDKQYISNKHYASALKLADQVGRQANGWKRKFQ